MRAPSLHACAVSSRREQTLGKIPTSTTSRTASRMASRMASGIASRVQRWGMPPDTGFSVPKFQCILASGATARGRMAKWMPLWDSAHRIGLVRYFQGLSNCSGGISRGGTPATGFWIPKFRYIQAWRATASSHMAKRMVRRHLAGQMGLVCYLQGLADCNGSISKVGNTSAGRFWILKIRHVPACSAVTISGMAKWMIWGDSAHRVGLVRYPQGLADCSGGI